jgi:hypothetical protein
MEAAAAQPRDSEPPLSHTRWNGIVLPHPAHWHPAVVQSEYLLFEDGYQPAMEIKWQRRARPCPEKKMLNRLSRRMPGTTFTPIELADLPAQFSATCLRWYRGSQTGMAIHLFCPVCRTSILCRFHGPAADPSLWLPMLAGLQDHAPPGQAPIPWAIFDLRFALPPNARLLRHAFVLGRYRLHFALHRNRLTIHRFKPAEELLTGRHLVEFGADLAQGLIPAKTSTEMVEWRNPTGRLSRVLTRLRRQPAERRLRLWHDTQHNVLLATALTGNDQTDLILFEAVSRSCHSL